MEPNPILAEIRATRDRIAKECDYDVRKLGERIRRRESEEKARGAKFVSFAPPEPSIVREEPPPTER
jgi:hypothetical protein